MRIVLSVFLMLHGAAHLAGFVGPWGFAPSIPVRTALFAGKVPVGSGAMKAIGAMWLLAGLMFVMAGIGGLRGAPWVAATILSAATLSLALSVSELPKSRIGVAINIAILTAFLVAGKQ